VAVTTAGPPTAVLINTPLQRGDWETCRTELFQQFPSIL
jgi:hypothetical protein